MKKDIITRHKLFVTDIEKEQALIVFIVCTIKAKIKENKYMQKV